VEEKTVTVLSPKFLIDSVDLNRDDDNDLGAIGVRVRKPKPRLPAKSIKLELPIPDELEERAAELVAHWDVF
jgi:hypothetical protein